MAKQAHDLYCAYLVNARDRHGLSFLQPGRFLCPGSLGDVPYLWFAPIDVREHGMFAPHTLGALMAERFETYKQEAVAPFYHDHFRNYSRQIVLVDVLRALLAGRDAFDDTRLALDTILESFRYGHGGILSKLLLGPHIDKVLFAATKADHVPDIQRDHLAALLRNMAAFPAIEVKSSNAQFDVTALASVISTAEDTQEIDGQRLQVVVGRPVGAAKQAKFFVGNVPIRPPRAGCLGLAVPQRAGVRAARDRSRRRSKGSRTSISTWRSNSCWETGCDDGSIRPHGADHRARDRDRRADEIARPRPIGAAGDRHRANRTGDADRAVGGGGRAAAAVRRRDGVITFGLASVAVFFVGWLAVDAAAWISAAFERSAPLGVVAAVAISAGVAGAGAVIARELVSLFRLKNVETIHRRFADQHVPPADARRAIADVLAVVPRERETAAAIESFQRQVQLHHSTAQQIEILSRTVMKPLDHRAEAHVRTAVLRAFGITAISPTALTDAVFFLACGVRMVRGIAASYGHRPTAATTIHLLRRLVLEAGKLGAVDIASASLVQHLGGAVTERLATSAADALYASYRMARLGIIVMDLCRPIPFQENDVPSVTSLVGNVVRRRSEAQPD